MDAARQRCVVCGTVASAVCRGCKSVGYCGETCQRTHWKEMGHRKKCKELRAAQAALLARAADAASTAVPVASGPASDASQPTRAPHRHKPAEPQKAGRRCALCTNRSSMTCPRKQICQTPYCDADCANAHWQSGHGDRCGEDEENSCPVCLEDMEYRFELPCNHMICEGCMTDMMPTDNKICPLCRDPGFSYQAHGSSPTFAMGTDLVKKAERLQALGLSDKAKMVFEKAASNFRQTIRSDPTMQYVHANLGSVLVKLGKHTVAGPVLVKAVDRDKTDQKAHYLLGLVRLMANNPQAAVPMLEIAVQACTAKLRPGDPKPAVLRDYEQALSHAVAGEHPYLEAPLRFKVGDRVECCQYPDGETGPWRTGVVSVLWHREDDWLPEDPSSPYQVLFGFDGGQCTHSRIDADSHIRRARR